jgi:Asp-tRNA(Asn)/Glu-tRNA(Gln) amidotransferase A subunit family amidase
MDQLLATLTVILAAEASAVHRQQAEQQAEYYGRELLSLVRVGELIPAAAYLHAQRLRRQLRARVVEALGDRDAFLSPTVSTEAPGLSTTGDRTLQAPWSLLGFPAISLPSGLSKNGLPLAIQLGAPQWRDGELLQVAAWCEARLNRLPFPSGLDGAR